MFQSKLLKIFYVFLVFVSLQTQAAGPFCSELFRDEYQAPYRITITDLRNSFRVLNQVLLEKLKQSPNPYAEYSFAEPYNAFFKSSGNEEEARPWKSLARELRLTRPQLESSWKKPLYLSPMDIALYKGHLFPASYFIRRTALKGLNRGVPVDFPSYGEKLPYASVKGSNVEVHEAGGSKKLFELWLEEHRSTSSDNFATLYRACSRQEYELQIFIRDLKAGDLDQPISEQDVKLLDRIASSSEEYDQKSELERLVKFAYQGHQSRRQLVSRLIQSIAFLSGGVFTSFDEAGARGFKRENDVIIKYHVPLSKLQQLIFNNEAYLGIEFSYFELAFIDEPNQQNAKSILFASIFSVGE